jgi:hypothetical protein
MAVLTGSGELNIGYKGKMFGQPEVKYTLEHTIPDGDSPEEGKMIRAAYQKLWEVGMNKLKKTRAAAIKKAMDDTEKAIIKKPPANMDAFIATANKLIQQGVDVFRQVEIVKLAEECLSKVYDAVEKALKKAVVRKQVKTVMKIVVLVLITLAVAAVSIAATVLTGGALAAVVLVSIGTGVGAIIASAKVIKKEYDSYNGTIDKIQKDILELEKAVTYQEKKAGAAAWRKLGPAEKVKLLVGGCGPIIKKMNGHIMEAEGALVLTRKAFNEAVVKANETAAELQKMESHPDTKISAEAAKARTEAKKAEYQLNKFLVTQEAFAKLKAEAKVLTDRVEKNGEFEGGNISKLVKFAEGKQETVSFLIDAGKALVTALSKLQKALGK